MHQLRRACFLATLLTVAALITVVAASCTKDEGTSGTDREAPVSETPVSEAPASTAVDVCETLTPSMVGQAVGVEIRDTARLFGNDDPRACAYYLDNSDSDPGYAVSVITKPDSGKILVDSRCSGEDETVVEVERGDRACTVGGNDLVVLRGDGYVEVAIGILVVDLPDEAAYRTAALAIYDALEPSL